MRIIKDNMKTIQVECNCCGSILEIDRLDIRQFRNIDACSEKERQEKIFQCIRCKNLNTANEEILKELGF